MERKQLMIDTSDTLLRELLWSHHGCPSSSLIRDGEELRCTTCLINFNTGSPEQIRDRFTAIQNALKPETDEFGLPTHISESSREVTGEGQTSHEYIINLNELAQEIDKVRVIFRSQGIEIFLEEMWQNGMILMSIRTEKGQAQFASYNPSEAGYGAMRVSAPVEIL